MNNDQKMASYRHHILQLVKFAGFFNIHTNSKYSESLQKYRN